MALDDLDFGFSGDGDGLAGFGSGPITGGSSSGSSGGSDGSLFGGAGGILKGVGGLVGGLMDSSAYKEQAGSYKEAAAFARENAGLAEEATTIKSFQEQRKIDKALGGIRATQAANGFGAGGSGLYLLRDSTMQGGLAEAQIGLQGTIEKNAYLAQAAKAEGEAKAAESASKKSTMGGIFSAVSSIAGLLL